MFRINVPWSEGYLVLTPQLGPLPRFVQAGILALALGVLLFLIFRLYRYELQFIPKLYSRALLALRLLVVGLIFAATTLRPSMRYTAHETVPSHVLIAIDRSDSMNVADPQREPIEKLELARGLKLGADLADDKTIAAWIERLRQSETPVEPAYTRLIERVDELPRKALVERVLAPDGAALLKTLEERHKLQIVGFDERLGDLPPNFDSIRAILQDDGKRSGEGGTDLNLPLNHGLELRDQLKDGLVGIVIFSDGQHNWGGIPGELAHRLGHTDNKPRVPVFTVVCGAKAPPPDLVIASAMATPSIVFKHGSANVDVRLLANNLPACKIKITIAYPDSPDLPKRAPIIEFVDFDGVNQPSPRTIPVRMDRAAAEKLTVTAEAIAKDGSPIDERFPDNNTKQVVIHVAPDKAKVLAIDGEARWEQHYLQTALQRDPTMLTRSVVFDQPRLNLVKDDELAAMKLPDLRLPGPDELAKHDCIILGDVSPEQLPLEEQLRLERFVANRGGTLVILAGKRAMPLDFLDAGPLARMLPITNPRVVDKKEGFKIALTGAGLQTGFLRLTSDAAASAERWANLPPHYWAVVGKAKDGAVPLACVPREDRRANIDDERASALIVRQHYGFGQVVFVGLDSTWRWRFKQGDTIHHRFWSQLIRWAASDRALIAGNEYVRFGVREPVYRSDQEIQMLARLGEKAKTVDKNAIAGARLFRKSRHGAPEEAVALTPLKPNPEVPGQYEGTHANLPPGEYSMEFAMANVEDKLNGPDGKRLRASFTVLPPENGEMLNLATNWERMKEIADKSGGLMVSADKAGEIIEKLKARSGNREFTTDKRLWQSWWLLAPLLGLLTVEWLIRKWAGLS